MGKDRDADPPGRLRQDRREAPELPWPSPEEAPATGETGPEDEG